MLVAYGVDEFTRAAELDLEVRQSADLAEMLQVHSETGKWRWPEWRMTEHAPNLLAARALFGLLVLNENVLGAHLPARCRTPRPRPRPRRAHATQARQQLQPHPPGPRMRRLLPARHWRSDPDDRER